MPRLCKFYPGICLTTEEKSTENTVRVAPKRRICTKSTWSSITTHRNIESKINYSMRQIPSWEANRFSASQKFPRILWPPKVHYHIHRSTPPVPVLSQLDPVQTPTSHFLKIHLIIILPSTPGSPKWSLNLRFPYQNPVDTCPLPHTRYMPRPSNSRFYHQSNIGWGSETNINMNIRWQLSVW